MTLTVPDPTQASGLPVESVTVPLMPSSASALSDAQVLAAIRMRPRPATGSMRSW